ncbi:MAG: NAD-dependent epimerase/dehydratase family protein [Betaproteobacteria bacterium]|nr:NAD-dependent epimerase/dehydratase family protein [Betaproteobacteria bacterium]
MARVLVTGGCGFIGSHLVEALLRRGYELTVLDDLSSGRLENLPRGERNIRFVEGSITDPESVGQAMGGAGLVIHLAAVSSVQASIEDPLATHRINCDGTLHLLEACRKQGVNKFMFASSAAVYGDPASLPLAEDAAPNPLTPYAFDKLGCELYVAFYHRQFGLDTTIFRLFNVFGPRQDPRSPYSGVISRFVDCVLAGRPITVHGDGMQSRDFVYVEDVAELIAGSLAKGGLSGQTINVGTGRQQALVEVIAALKALAGRELQVQHEKPRDGDVRHSVASTGRLRALLGDLPEASFARGLRKLFDSAARS